MNDKEEEDHEKNKEVM